MPVGEIGPFLDWREGSGYTPGNEPIRGSEEDR
jgi:hypothetical protein